MAEPFQLPPVESDPLSGPLIATSLRPIDPNARATLGGFVEPTTQDAGGAKPIDLTAREKLGGYADPFAEFKDATPQSFDEFQDAPDEFSEFQTADDLDVRSVEDLNNDREKFDTRTYFSEHPEVAEDPKRLQKLLAVHRMRDVEGLTTKGVVTAAKKNTPGFISGTAQGAVKLVENGIEVLIQPSVNFVLGALTGDLKNTAFKAETWKGIKKAHAEGQAALESSATGLADVARQGLQKLENQPGQVGDDLPGTRVGRQVSATAPKSDQQLLQELSADVEFRKNAADVIKGQGEVAKATGLDAETLAKEGIVLDEKAIEHLSLVEPVTMLATGGAFKIVGLGGKVLATARTAQAAENFVNKLGNFAKSVTGKTIAKTGEKISRVGTKFEGRGASIAGTAIGAALGTGASLGTALKTAAIIKTVGPAMRFTGPFIETVGKKIAGEIPSSGMNRLIKIAEAGTKAGVVVGEGAATGAAVSLPFALSVYDDDAAGTLLGAGTTLGAGGAGVAGIDKGFRVVKNRVAREYFGPNRKTIPDVNSPGYGRVPELDSLHASEVNKLSTQNLAELNNFREGLRSQGGEIYAVNKETFRSKVADEYKSRTGRDLDPAMLDVYENHHAFFDETQPDGKKVVYLNSDTTGLRHDAGHIFDALLSPEKQSEINQAIKKSFTPEQITAFKNKYERDVGNKISEDFALSEFRAEQFGALFSNVPVTDLAAPKSLLRTFAGIAAEGAEALGVDLTGGRTTPALQAPQTIGLRSMFEYAARDVLKAGQEAAPTPPPSGPGGTPPNVTPLPPTPPPSGVPPTTPPTNVVPLVPPPANVVPLTPARPIRTTPEAPKTPEARAAAAKRFEVSGIAPARELAAKLADPVGIKAVEDISAQMGSGNPVLEVEHLGIKSEGTPETPEGRTSRRATQAAAYEVLKGELSRAGAPEDLVNRHIKTFVPVRWEPQGGSPTLIAMSLDKVLTNLKEIAKDPKAKDLIPYPTENGKLTPEGWTEAVSDFQKYAENQANGRKGDGGRLVVPEAGEISVPVENPSYTPQPLSPEKADFANLIQGLGTPATGRSIKGKIPGNIKGQLVAEANLRPVELPVNIPAKQTGKQAFVEFPPRVVQEVNPLRNRMKTAGVDTSILHEVTERIRAQDIEKVTPRPDLTFSAPVTDIIRGGFLPAPTEFRSKNLGGRTVEEFSDYVLRSTPAEFKAATENMTGGLTGGAWNFGLGLKNAADVGVLKSFQEQLSSAAKTAMQSGDFDAAYSAVSKGQFFREAYEAATGTGSAGAAFKRGTAGMESAKPPFPIESTTTGTTSGTTGDATRFQPAEQLDTGPTPTEPDLRIVPTPAAAGGTPPIEPPAGMVIPPPVAAGRFQPAEQLNPDQTPDLRVVPAAAGGTPPIEPPGRGMIPPPIAAKEDQDSAKFQPTSSKEIQDLAKKYADDTGIPYAPTTGYAEIKPDLSKRLAKFYDDAKSDPTNPEVAKSYAALIKETEDQGKAILAAGYKIEPWMGAGEPYKDSAAAIADVRDNKHLFFRKTSDSFGTGESNAGNPMLAESNLVPGQSANDVFRWVHDFFGHSKEGFQFGPRGEFNAWRAHSEMYSPDAQGALAGETLAQNSWVNFGPHLEGKNIPLAERPFAEQKNVVVPPELIAEAGKFQPRTEAGRKLEEKGYEIVATGEMGTRRVTILDKNKEAIAQIQSVQLSPKKAEISFVSKKEGAPAGLGEVLYREVGSRLRDDGVKSLGGHVIRPEPLVIRKKIFGGFKKLTVNDEPATYAEALATAERLRYSGEGVNEVAAIEPVNEITAATKFLPRDAQGRPLDKEGNIDYAKWQAESVAANRKREAEPIAKSVPKGKASVDLGTATGWVLPNKEFVPLDAAFHEQYLANNAADLNKKFKTKFSETPSVDDRLDALNAGFVRLRNQGGAMRVEANAERWNSLKSTVLDTLRDREGKIDGLTVSLLNRKGQQVDSASAPRLQELSGPEKMDAIEDAVNSLRSGAFLPAEGGLPGFENLSPEELGRAKAARRISTVKKNHPEAVTPQYARNEDGEIIVTPDGTPKPLTLDYDFVNSPLAKEAAKGLKGAKREEAAAVAIGEKLVDFYRQAEKNPDLKAGSKWYSTARTRLRGVFGDDSKFFAELLGATSARTPVATNYRFALDAYNQFKAGAFDKTLAKYREGKAAWDAQELGDFKGETRGQFMDFWVAKYNLGVTQASGKKYGMNSRAVLRVLDGSWASEVVGPKTPNFAGNLTGESFRATIDVWAGRTLHRLANEGRKDRWRILPENETGINDRDFYFGQAAYEVAAKKLGVKADSVQSVLWFAEKRHWEDRGWTRGAGAELSDFNVLLKETEKTPTGMKMKTPQTEFGLDFSVKVDDLKKKKR